MPTPMSTPTTSPPSSRVDLWLTTVATVILPRTTGADALAALRTV